MTTALFIIRSNNKTPQSLWRHFCQSNNHGKGLFSRLALFEKGVKMESPVLSDQTHLLRKGCKQTSLRRQGCPAGIARGWSPSALPRCPADGGWPSETHTPGVPGGWCIHPLSVEQTQRHWTVRSILDFNISIAASFPLDSSVPEASWPSSSWSLLEVVAGASPSDSDPANSSL